MNQKCYICVAFRGKTFGNTIYTTSDFTTFTQITNNLSGRLSKASYKDGVYVAAGIQSRNNNAYLVYSINLAEWTEINPIIDETGSIVTKELNFVLIM